LQDVFSDSANLVGMRQKTSCLPTGKAGLSEIGQEKLVATPKKEMKKSSKNARAGGRKKLPTIQLKKKKLQMHVTEWEYKNIQSLCCASGKRQYLIL